MNKLYKKATNEKQYDDPEIKWAESIDWLEKLHLFFFENINKYNSDWKNKKVLDIGCGTGWLVEIISEKGSKLSEGIEPSIKNYKAAKKKHAHIKIYNKSLQKFKTKTKYDILISSMAFNHIANLEEAFEKCSTLLQDKGKFFLLVPDYDWARRKREKYTLEIEKLNKDEYLVNTERSLGTIADIIRKTKIYITAAEKAGLYLKSEIKMKPTPQLAAARDSYKNRATIARMLILYKK